MTDARRRSPAPGAVAAAAVCLGLLVTLGPAPAPAQQIYRWVDAHGNVRYSGFPPPSGAATEAPAALPGPAARPGLEPVREKPATADEMLALSGLRARLPRLVREVVADLADSQAQLTEPERGTVRSVAERAFDPTRVYALLRDEYERRSPPERRPGAAAWFRSPAGRRIVETLLESTGEADAAALAAFGAALRQRPPTPARLELIERLDWVTGSSELSADLVFAVQRGLALGLTRRLPREQRLRPGPLDAEAQERRPAVVTAVRAAVRDRLLYVLRDLTDEDIRQCIEFEGSPDGRAHNRALNRGLLHAFAVTAERAGTDLARALPARPDGVATPGR